MGVTFGYINLTTIQVTAHSYRSLLLSTWHVRLLHYMEKGEKNFKSANMLKFQLDYKDTIWHFGTKLFGDVLVLSICILSAKLQDWKSGSTKSSSFNTSMYSSLPDSGMCTGTGYCCLGNSQLSACAPSLVTLLIFSHTEHRQIQLRSRESLALHVKDGKPFRLHVSFGSYGDNDKCSVNSKKKKIYLAFK